MESPCSRDRSRELHLVEAALWSIAGQCLLFPFSCTDCRNVFGWKMPPRDNSKCLPSFNLKALKKRGVGATEREGERENVSFLLIPHYCKCMFDFPFGFICLHLSAAIGSHYAFLCVSRYLSNIWDLSSWRLLSPITIFLIKWIELLLVPCSQAFPPLYLVVFVILSSTISKRFLATFEKCICESCYQHTSIGFTQAVWSYKAHFHPFACD